MKENFDRLRGMTLVTIQQAQNLHVLLTPELDGKLVITKGRCAAFIAEGILYVTKEFSKGGAYNNAIIDTEIELIKNFYSLTSVISENEIEEISKALEKIQNYIQKILTTEDAETKQIIFNEAQTLVNTSKIPNKDEMIKNLKDAIEGIVKDVIEPPAAINSNPELSAILEKMKDETDPIQVQELFEQALELQEASPIAGIEIFRDIRNLHTNFFKKVNAEAAKKEADKKAKQEAAKKAAEAEAKKSAAKKAAPKKVVTTKRK